ncbi:MAG: PhoH family protein [Anaeroplasmataceae bacterium]|nr:PhoH family protein [Anaeroplasmataceae bacterium]
MKLQCRISNANDAKNICGIENNNLKTIEELFDCMIDIHGDSVLCNLEDENKIDALEQYMNALVLISSLGIHITARDIIYLKRMIELSLLEEYIHFLKTRKPIGYNQNNKPVYAKTLQQQEYLRMLEKKDLIFSIGSAGSGKTYLAVVYAVTMLKKGIVQKIILTRPAVEAGESLGFLPGDLKEKVDPYLRPLYDALYDMLGLEQTNALIEKQILEIAPLAYMRGRTLENAIIILDEAQNATVEQLKMFLTRLGFNSKMIVTGDCSQVDLPNSKRSGLKIASEMLKDLKEVGVIEFAVFDVVRHPLVGKIIERFEKLSNE